LAFAIASAQKSTESGLAIMEIPLSNYFTRYGMNQLQPTYGSVNYQPSVGSVLI
jgi:hypothetical protein